MPLYKLIRSNRALIDAHINAVLFRYDGNGGRGTIPNPPPKRNDEERRMWVLSNEDLYTWARREGCRI